MFMLHLYYSVHVYYQCWGKLLWNVMHYNITLLSYFLESNALRLRYFPRYFLKHEAGLDCLFLITRSSIYSKCKSPFTPKRVMINLRLKESKSRLYRRKEEKKFTIFSKLKQTNKEAQLLVCLKQFFAYYYGWTRSSRSTAKASDNKMTEIRYICEQLTYLSVAGLRPNLSLHFTV